MIEIEIQSIFCLACRVVRQVKLIFARWRRSYTQPFEKFALSLSNFMTISDVAKHLRVSWITVKDIQKEALTKRIKKPKLKKLDRIVIDEISIGTRYLENRGKSGDEIESLGFPPGRVHYPSLHLGRVTGGRGN